MFLGLGFEDRADSFDLQTTLHDYFKGLLVSFVTGIVNHFDVTYSRLKNKLSKRKMCHQRSWTWR